MWSPQCSCYPPTPHTQPWTSDLVGPDVGVGTMEIGRTLDFLFPDFYYLRHLVLPSGSEKLKDVQKVREEKELPNLAERFCSAQAVTVRKAFSNGPQTKDQGRSP